MKLVSILIPTYNQPEFFRQALKSALAQDYPNIEIIVSDDSTDDRVEKVVEEFLSKPQKFPIYYEHRQKPKDPKLDKGNYQHLLERSHGEFINYLLHDDLFMPDKISRMMKFFDQDPDKNIPFVTSNRYVIDENGWVLRVFGVKNVTEDHIVFSGEELIQRVFSTGVNYIGEPTTVLVRKELLFDETTHQYELFRYIDRLYPAHGDLQMFLQLCQKKNTLVPFIVEPLSCFRRNPKQNSLKAVILFKCYIEFAEFIARSFLNDLYIHDVDFLQVACDAWLKQTNITANVLKNQTYNLNDFPEMDLLIEIVSAAENHDYERFLRLATSRKKLVFD